MKLVKEQKRTRDEMGSGGCGMKEGRMKEEKDVTEIAREER